MKLEQLRHFLTAAEQLHIGKAGKILHVTPSTISHSIAALEEEFGCELFFKRGRNVFLTQDGETLMREADHLLAHARDVQEKMSDGISDSKSYLRMAASHGLSSRLLTPAWCEVAKTFPNLECEIYSFRSGRVVEDVLNRHVDFGICFSPQPHPDLEITHLYSGHMKIYIKQEEKRRSLDKRGKLQYLASKPACLPKAFSGIEICESHEMFDQHKIPVQSRMAFDSYEVAVESIIRGSCWSFMPDIIESWFPGDLVPLEFRPWSAPYQLSLLRHKNSYFGQIELALMNQVSQLLKSAKLD